MAQDEFVSRLQIVCARGCVRRNNAGGYFYKDGRRSEAQIRRLEPENIKGNEDSDTTVFIAGKTRSAVATFAKLCISCDYTSGIARSATIVVTTFLELVLVGFHPIVARECAHEKEGAQVCVHMSCMYTINIFCCVSIYLHTYNKIV